MHEYDCNAVFNNHGDGGRQINKSCQIASNDLFRHQLASHPLNSLIRGDVAPSKPEARWRQQRRLITR